METKLPWSQEFVGEEQRAAIPRNRFNLAGIDHVGIPCRDPVRAGKFVEQILGGVEIYRAGFTPEDRAKGRIRHIFYHVGAQLVEVVELPDARGYADQCNPDGKNSNPHWAFGATPEDLKVFVEHLKSEGIPFNGPRSHDGTSVVSVYFRDCEGNNLEVTTWTPFGPEFLPTTPMRGEYGFVAWANLGHNWQPK